MDEQGFHEKVKALFPHAAAIATSCGIQTRQDGTEMFNWLCSAFSTPISEHDTVKIGFGCGHSEEEALADIIADAQRVASVEREALCTKAA